MRDRATIHNPRNFVDASMELQVVAGLQQRVCEYPSLFNTHELRRISSCVLAPKLRKSSLQGRSLVAGERRIGVVVRCSSGSEGSGEAEVKKVVLKIGSPVVVTQSPPLLKTAEPMPMMRPNNGLINVGDAGRWVLVSWILLQLGC